MPKVRAVVDAFDVCASSLEAFLKSTASLHSLHLGVRSNAWQSQMKLIHALDSGHYRLEMAAAEKYTGTQPIRCEQETLPCLVRSGARLSFDFERRGLCERLLGHYLSSSFRRQRRRRLFSPWGT